MSVYLYKHMWTKQLCAIQASQVVRMLTNHPAVAVSIILTDWQQRPVIAVSVDHPAGARPLLHRGINPTAHSGQLPSPSFPQHSLLPQPWQGCPAAPAGPPTAGSHAANFP
jgi:hypothetical protein